MRFGIVERDDGGWHFLEIAAVISRLDADALQFVGQPLRGGLAILGAGSAPFERIARDRLVARQDVGAHDVGAGDRMTGILRERRHGEECQTYGQPKAA